MRYGLSTHHLVYEHPMQWLESSFHYFNNHKCIKWPNHHKDNWSLHCSSTNNNIIGLINENTTIMVQMVKIKLLSIINLRHLNDITSQNIAEYKIMPNLYSQNSTYKRMSRNTNLDCIMILDQHSRLSAFWGKMVRPVLQVVKPVLESGQTGLMNRLDQSVQRTHFGINNIGLRYEIDLL